MQDILVTFDVLKLVTSREIMIFSQASLRFSKLFCFFGISCKIEQSYSPHLRSMNSLYSPCSLCGAKQRKKWCDSHRFFRPYRTTFTPFPESSFAFAVKIKMNSRNWYRHIVLCIYSKMPQTILLVNNYS